VAALLKDHDISQCYIQQPEQPYVLILYSNDIKSRPLNRTSPPTTHMKRDWSTTLDSLGSGRKRNHEAIDFRVAPDNSVSGGKV